jgi:hypothetical protein
MRRPTNKGVAKMESKLDSDCTESRHHGFRHFLPFLAIPVAFVLMKGMAHHRYARMGEGGRAAWKNGVPPMFAELHRRAHAADADNPVVSEA